MVKIKSKPETKDAVPTAAPILTFTEDDCKAIEDFINFVYARLSGNISVKDMFTFHKLYVGAINHSKKCREHIMELISTTPRPK